MGIGGCYNEVNMSQNPAAQPAVIDYGSRPRPNRGSWLNVRVILFVLVVGAIISAPVYIYLQSTLTRGISAGPGGYLSVDLKSMSTFPFDQNYGKLEDVPAIYRNLDGKKVVLLGEMYVADATGSELKKFDLVYSIQKCCFSGPPQVQHFVKATPVDDKPLPYYGGTVRVKGTLKVDVTNEAGKVTSVYHVAVESIEPV